jgi:hypothetical protein
MNPVCNVSGVFPRAGPLGRPLVHISDGEVSFDMSTRNQADEKITYRSSISCLY